MTVFKTFWKVVKKYKGTIILYTVMLVVFGAINMAAGSNDSQYMDSKPGVFIVNGDEGSPLADNLVAYLEKNCEIADIKGDEESIDDAVFYRDVNYVIYIPDGYGNGVMAGENPALEVKSAGDYRGGLAEMMVQRYVRIQNVYAANLETEEAVAEAVNANLSHRTEIGTTSKVDVGKTGKAAVYFNFASYSIMAVVIFIICLVMSGFRQKDVNKRIIVSSMDYRKHNRLILLAGSMYALLVWALFVALGAVLIGKTLFTVRGAMFMANALIFTVCCLSAALLISAVVTDKNIINGIVNVVALGSAFLCGAFVPAQWLPESVLMAAHALPAYWYINSNDVLKTVEEMSAAALRPVFVNMAVLLGFTLLFIIITNIVSSKKRKIA